MKGKKVLEVDESGEGEVGEREDGEDTVRARTTRVTRYMDRISSRPCPRLFDLLALISLVHGSTTQTTKQTRAASARKERRI